MASRKSMYCTSWVAMFLSQVSIYTHTHTHSPADQITWPLRPPLNTNTGNNNTRHLQPDHHHSRFLPSLFSLSPSPSLSLCVFLSPPPVLGSHWLPPCGALLRVALPQTRLPNRLGFHGDFSGCQGQRHRFWPERVSRRNPP